MATVRTLLRLVEPIGVELPALGQTVEVSTRQGAVTVELPGYEWADDDRHPVRAIPPSGASVAVAHFKPEFFVDKDDLVGWGACWEWSKARREATMHVGALLASVEMDEPLIMRSDYLHGVGHPEGPAIHQMRLDLDSWRTRFVEWVSLVAGQAVSSATPAIPNNARPDAPNTVVWIEEDGKVAGLPSHQSDRVTITMVDEESEVLGFVVDMPMFERIRDLAASSIEPTTQLRLLRSARVAILRSEYRLALVELGSAAELCLWTVFDRDVRPSTAEERGRWTLGALVRQLHPAGDPRRAELIDGLVDPRNDAIHRAQECDKGTALRAFALVRQMVSDELPEPLPTL